MRSAELWKFPLEIVTAAFIGGSHPNEEAEVRVPSIRGALRTWYRRIVGPDVAAGLATEGAHDLRETRLFGGAGDEWGQSLAVLSLAKTAPTGKEQARLRTAGLKYLGFSLKMKPNDRVAVAPTTTFTLRLLFPKGISDRHANLYLATVWSWVTFGGLGTRCRRGFGSITWPDEPSFTDLHGRALARSLPAPVTSKTAQEMREHVASGLRRVHEIADAARRSLDQEPAPSFLRRDIDKGPAYHLDLRSKSDAQTQRTRVVVWGGASGGFASAESAVDAVGSKFSEFRRQSGIDGLTESPLRSFEAGRTPAQAPARVAFGLPLTFRNVRRGGQGFEVQPLYRAPNTRTSEGENAERNEGRRAASPLLIRICPVGTRYFVVLTLLSGAWPGRDYAVRERRAPHAFMPENADIDLPARFLESLNDGVEVIL